MPAEIPTFDQFADLPVTEMQRVDWEHRTRAEVAAFGLQLSLYNDAYNEHQKAKVGVWTYANALVVSFLVTLALLLWQEPANVILVSVMVSLHVGFALRLWHLHRMKRDMRRAHTELVQEVDGLRGQA